MAESVIRTLGLTKSFGDIQVLKGLNLEIPAHAIVGFLGPNGAGKSTTIKILLGLIHPTSGSGTVFGKDIVRESRAIRQRVGYLAQKPKFDDTMTPRQVLQFVAKFFYSGPQSAIDARVEESLALVGLSDKADRVIRNFSGGEIQRLGIAQAQINEPDLLILDEPAAALDPMGRRDVLNIMENLREKSTIFYSTHILDDVQRVSDHVLILNKGEIVSQGPIETLLQGDGGVVYHVALCGNIEAAKDRVSRQPWVSNIYDKQVNGAWHWSVGITDLEAAQAQLLHLIIDERDVQVIEYRPETYELEDVFIELVK